MTSLNKLVLLLGELNRYSIRLASYCGAMAHPHNQNPDDQTRMKEYIEDARAAYERQKETLIAFIVEHNGYQFNSRGIGSETGPCFMTGEQNVFGKNVAAFVSSRSDGDRIVHMFRDCGGDARLDYRPSEPNWIQVKTTISDPKYMPNLEALDSFTHAVGGYINPDIIHLVRDI